MQKIITFIPILFILITSCKKVQDDVTTKASCDVTEILKVSKPHLSYSPNGSKYFISRQDTINGVFQIYVGNTGDTNTLCISNTYSTGNCCGLYRHWKSRNKVMVQWHPSGNYIICGVEKEFYPELLYIPYSLLLGWIQSGLWLDIWAVKPDGSHWYNLANTVTGMTGPAFTPDGTKCVYAEAQNGGNLAIDKFGIWKFQLADFAVNSVTPSFANTRDISPAGSRWLEPGNFAPDGVSLLFNSDIGMLNAEGQDQYILNISTGQVTNLTNSPMVWDEHGVFSPDGKKILLMSSYPYRADTNTYHTLTIKTEFMLMNRDGSGLQQLTHFRTPGYPESSNGIAATGYWSTDGKQIYAQSLIFPDYENWIIRFYGACGR
jgi:Tol biopolymer transport system component